MLTAVELGRGQDNHDQIRTRVLPRNVVASQACHGPSEQHREYLETQHSLQNEKVGQQPFRQPPTLLLHASCCPRTAYYPPPYKHSNDSS